MNLKINWKLALFSIFFGVMFGQLSFWQFERAEEKVLLIQKDKDRRNLPGVTLDQLPAAEKALDGIAVEIEGHFDTNKIFLLDNIVLNGVVGFEVLAPFNTDVGKWVLVNRGFIPMGKTRSDMPSIPVFSSEHQKIKGHLYVTRSRGPDEHFTSGDQSPYVVQSYDPSRIESILGYELLPQIFRLGEDEADALPRYWPLVIMQPERHIGYAYTWLLMAITVAIAFGAFTYQTNRVHPTNRDHPTNRVTENDI